MAATGSTFADGLRVRVLDNLGRPMKGARVTFQAPTSGAWVTFGGRSWAKVSSDANGYATSVAPQAGGVVGTARVSASVQGGPPASFALAVVAPLVTVADRQVLVAQDVVAGGVLNFKVAGHYRVPAKARSVLVRVTTSTSRPGLLAVRAGRGATKADRVWRIARGRSTTVVVGQVGKGGRVYVANRGKHRVVLAVNVLGWSYQKSIRVPPKGR